MIGSASYSPPSSTALARRAVPVVVYRHDPDEGTQEAMPNLECLAISTRDGPSPGGARFRYRFDVAHPEWPGSFEEVLPLSAQGRYVLSPDDRIKVIGFTSLGKPRVLFDGFAHLPELHLADNREIVTVEASSVAIRCYDDALVGSVQRHATQDLHSDPEANATTQTPCRFNANGLGNATLEDEHDAVNDEARGGAESYPVFLDSAFVTDDNHPDPGKKPRKWSLAMAVRYLLSVGNPTEDYVYNPAFDDVDELLKVFVEAEDEDAEDEDQDIVIFDYDATGKPWPTALHDLLARHGFGMRFETTTLDDEGAPRTYLRLFRSTDSSAPPKLLLLQARGQTVNPARTGVQSARLARDTKNLVNAYSVESQPTRHEITVVLAPAFTIAEADADVTSKKRFLLSHPDHGDPLTSNSIKYRRFIFAEANDLTWEFDAEELAYPWPNADALDPILGDPDSEGVRPYAVRRRGPLPNLLTLDSLGEPKRATLAISTDYAGVAPDLWDGSGTWQPCSPSSWRLLKDRIGIEVTADDPDSWNIGESRANGLPIPSGVARLVTGLAAPTELVKRPYLRLTCVIEGDDGVNAYLRKNRESPAKFSVSRVLDTTDRFRVDQVEANTEFLDDDEPSVVRNDYSAAFTYGRSFQRATELGKFAGSVTIPRLTNAYAIGDRVKVIAGRDLSLRIDSSVGLAKEDQEEEYPVVVGIDYQFGGGQSTVLQLSDQRANS